MCKTLGALAIITVCVVAWFVGFPESPVASAQKIRDPEVERQKREWDKSVTDEKLQRIRAETETIRQSIVNLMDNKFSKYGEVSTYTYDPKATGIGRRGQSGFQLNWKRGGAFLGMSVTFSFDPEDAEKHHSMQVDGRAMGEGFRAPESYGKDAVIFKNVTYNKGSTWVTLQFRKGRLNISCNMQNGFKSNTENEKEVLKIMEAIYPLLVAKERFEDV